MPLLAAFVFGLLAGSFLNVVISRLPQGQSVVVPRSRCPHCQAPIAPYDNIPVLSYLFLRGRCRRCSRKISARYPAVELLAGVTTAAAFWKFGLTPAMILNAGFFCALIALIFIDLYHRILPDVITLPLAASGFALSFFQSPSLLRLATTEAEASGNAARWMEHSAASLLGITVGAGSLWLVSWAYYRLRKIEGLGRGDIKLMAAVGAFLGWQLTILTIFLGSLAGAIIGSGYMIYKGKDFRYELPFGTFLGAAAVVAALSGPQMIHWYASFYS